MQEQCEVFASFDVVRYDGYSLDVHVFIWRLLVDDDDHAFQLCDVFFKVQKQHDDVPLLNGGLKQIIPHDEAPNDESS